MVTKAAFCISRESVMGGASDAEPLVENLLFLALSTTAVRSLGDCLISYYYLILRYCRTSTWFWIFLLLCFLGFTSALFFPPVAPSHSSLAATALSFWAVVWECSATPEVACCGRAPSASTLSSAGSGFPSTAAYSRNAHRLWARLTGIFGYQPVLWLSFQKPIPIQSSRNYQLY